jgi:hypothetical protein
MKTSIEKAVEYFRMKDSFTSEELWDFWRKIDSDLNRNAFYRRVYRLKNETGMTEIFKNTYTFSEIPYFIPKKESFLSFCPFRFDQSFLSSLSSISASIPFSSI